MLNVEVQYVFYGEKFREALLTREKASNTTVLMETTFVGVQGHVVGIKKETGELLWKTHLDGGFGDSFVSLATDGALVFAHTRGKLFCLDASSGQLLWKNDLPGLGYGMASICALAGTPDSPSALKAHQKKSAGS